MLLADPQAPTRRRARRRGAGPVALDALVVAGVLAAVLFPALARIAANRQPVAPRAAVTLPPVASSDRPAAPQRLPAGLARGAGAPRRAAELRPLAVALLGERRATALLDVVRVPTLALEGHRFPEVERLIGADVDPVAATDLGARLVLLRDEERAPSADIAAYVLFDRARASGGCAPNLDLLFLLTADSAPDDRSIQAAGERAGRACPGDPTPLWLLAQYASQTDPAGAGARALRALRTAFGTSPAAWAAEADGALRIAYTERPERVFVTRHHFERALASYRRAERLGGPSPELDVGIARALAGLARPAQAAALQQRAIARRPPSALLQAWLVEYLEAAHRFAPASAAAARLQTLAGVEAPARGLFPQPPTVLDALSEQDAYGPLSLGAGTLRPVSVDLGRGDVGAAGPVTDLSFLPVFRPSEGVTGSDRWCADWARRRDALLAGRPAVTRADPPELFTAVDGNGCYGEPALLSGLAALELGDVGAARASGLGLDALEDERQNLWRWAGDLGRAQRAARQWAARRPAVLPRIRLGEIEFLRGRHDDAARHFDAAARLARESGGGPQEAEALLKRGAALIAGGRRDEGLPLLRTADDLAARTTPDAAQDVGLQARSWSYYALVQLGDAQREAGALPAAADAYAAARRLEPRLADAGSAFRVAALGVNSAIVELGLGDAERGRRLALRAVAVDPRNPVYLMTAGFAAERAGRAEEAIGLNRRALGADPTIFPAANDLGVLLARRGRDAEAVAALRRAVGADENYALGWFNLGVVLSGMGPRHLPAAQGALARAFALDPALRDRAREPTIDARTYRTRLDVSRPLPPEWGFAATQRHAPERTVGLAALLLLALGLARALGSARSGRGLAQQWLEPLARGVGRVRLPALARRRGVAVAGTVAVLVWPLARDPSGGWTAAVAGVLGLLVLVGVALRARAAVARRAGEAGAQETWPPGVLFGLGTALAGFTWTPLPVLREAGPRLHWAAPVALACVALPLVVLTAWLDIPLTRALAASALVMAASLLTPIKPVDGGAIAAAGGTAAGLTGVFLAVLLALGLV